MALLLLTCVSLNAGSLTLSWNPVDSADGYRVYWGTNSGEYFSSADCGSQTVYTISGLVNTLTYYAAVTSYAAIDGGILESDFSPELSVVIPPLPVPEGLQYLPDKIAWEYPEQPDTLRGFVVTRKEFGIKEVKTFRIYDPAARELAQSDLLPGSTYRFQVSAFTDYHPHGGTRLRTIQSGQSDPLVYQTPIRTYSGSPYWLDPQPTDAGEIRLVFFSLPGLSPKVVESGDLETWRPLGSMTEFTPGQYRYVDSPREARRFYRLAQDVLKVFSEK